MLNYKHRKGEIMKWVCVFVAVIASLVMGILWGGLAAATGTLMFWAGVGFAAFAKERTGVP